MIRVLVADDHKIVRVGIRHLLERETDITVVGEAKTGRQALQLTGQLTPDVVLMDVGMPDMNGIEATARIVAETPECTVLMLSMHSDRRFVAQSLKAGARGYLLKDCASDELVRAVRTVANNEVHICPKIAEIIINDYIQHVPDDLSATAAELTPREREVLQLIAEGKNTKEIAFMFEISAKTVETHRRQLMNRLKLFSIAELTKYAVRVGVASLDI